MRTTNQIVIILESVQKLSGHATIEEVFRRAKRRLPQLSLATVYRNLDRLVTELKIGRVFISAVPFFEANAAQHMHFVCRSCGEILDIPIDKKIKPIFEPLEEKGQRISEINFVAFGQCINCSEKSQR